MSDFSDPVEISDETGISYSAIAATDPYDGRWGDVWERSYEIRGGSSWDDKISSTSADERDRIRRAADHQAFLEIFGK